MKATVVVGEGAEATLELRDVPAPEPGPHELLIAIKAAGLNRTDLRRAQQHYAARAVHVAGLECAGEVIGMGNAVRGFAIGDRVMTQGNGCYAERVAVDHRMALEVPAGMSWIEAAAIPVTFPTAHDALITAGRMAAGETVLVHAVTSAVGLSAVQLARALGASAVYGTATSTEKLARLAALGLDRGIDLGREDFARTVMAASADHGADVVVDMIGKGVLGATMKAAALGGRIVSVGRMGGFVDEIDLDLLALRRLALVGVTFRTRTIEQKQAVNAAFLRDVGPHLASGKVKPIIDRTFPLDQALAAQAHMRANRHLGKIVLEV